MLEQTAALLQAGLEHLPFRRVDHPRQAIKLPRAQLIMLGLPTISRELDPQQGLGFKLLRQQPGGPPVMAGHMNGVITIDVSEADPAHRERVRQNMHEPYR